MRRKKLGVGIVSVIEEEEPALVLNEAAESLPAVLVHLLRREPVGILPHPRTRYSSQAVAENVEQLLVVVVWQFETQPTGEEEFVSTERPDKPFAILAVPAYVLPRILVFLRDTFLHVAHQVIHWNSNGFGVVALSSAEVTAQIACAALNVGFQARIVEALGAHGSIDV
jgi:hypothetical protein